jgi:multiple sugar transport system permease protein
MTTASSATSLSQQELEIGKRQRKRRESILAYLFVAPATIITFIFGIWPVVFGFFVSLHQWRANSHNFLGLDQYVRALGNFAYVLAFFISLLFAYGGYIGLRKGLREMRDSGTSFWAFLPAGLVLAIGTIGFSVGFAAQTWSMLLPGLALIAVGGGIYWWTSRQVQSFSSNKLTIAAWQLCLLWILAVALFVFTVSELISDTATPLLVVRNLVPDLPLATIGEQMLATGLLVLAIGGVMGLRWLRRRFPEDEAPDWFGPVGALLTLALVAAAIGLFLYLISSFAFIHQALVEVQDLSSGDVLEVGMAVTGMERSEFRRAFGSLTGETLGSYIVSWSQIFSIAIGVILMVTAYRSWKAASRRETNLGMGGFVLLAIVLAVGGYLLISELPQALGSGDTDYLNSLLITAWYAVGTVPMQLFLGIFLSYLLFYEINIGKSLYRMIYFMPYVAPTVATATVFGIIFSSRDYSLSNRFLGLLGLPAQNWLLEAKGIFQIIAELVAGPDVQLPGFLTGPSLALVAIILYNIWVFAGYNAVIFLAGLGSIPGDLYEAAKVDGAGRWQAFRRITFPLLSPTTFFLTLLGITGTFRAFTHVYVMRQAAARGTADTASVHIFVQFWQFNQWGYASAMSFVLFGIILILTLIQNEVSRERVFYG